MKTTSNNTTTLNSFTSTIGACILAFSSVIVANAGTNTTSGDQAGGKITTGKNNTALGFKALAKNKKAKFNTAIGSGALKNATGSSNVAVGFKALFLNKKGAFNVAIGDGALMKNVTGTRNIAIGEDAGFNITGNDNIDIGNQGVAGESGVIRIGETSVHSRTVLAGQVEMSGGLRVPGAGVGTSGPVFIHTTAAENVVLNSTVITNPFCDGDPDAILLVTPNRTPNGESLQPANNNSFSVLFNLGKWRIVNSSLTAMPVGTSFNVMVVKP